MKKHISERSKAHNARNGNVRFSETCDQGYAKTLKRPKDDNNSIHKFLRDKERLCNLFLAAKPGHSKLINNPEEVAVDASSVCQLNCPLCSTGTGDNKDNIIGSGHLRFSDFMQLLDNNAFIKRMELANLGEIFLNPELKEIIKYAFLKKVHLKANIGVNLNSVDEDIIESLVKYEFQTLKISIDGATNRIYQIYRKGGNFHDVINNIMKINYYKKKYESEFPKLIWQFIIFGHNEHEIPKAREMAKKLNMKFMLHFNYNPSYSPIKDQSFVKEVGGLDSVSREEYGMRHKKNYSFPCSQFWVAPRINWDGALLGCCVNRSVGFGNVFQFGLDKCLNSEKFIFVKQVLLGVRRMRNDLPCYNCSRYNKENSLRLYSLFKEAMLGLK